MVKKVCETLGVLHRMITIYRKRRRQERFEEKMQERKEIGRYADEEINRIYYSD